MLKSEKKAREIKRQQQIAELKRRRVALLKHAHTLPEGEEKEKFIEQARKIYDGLTKFGVKII